MTVSCSTNVKDKAKSYAEELKEATKEGDTEKVAEVTEEFQEWVEGLSPEEAAEAARYFH